MPRTIDGLQLDKDEWMSVFFDGFLEVLLLEKK
jgi:hypothetical protein